MTWNNVHHTLRKNRQCTKLCEVSSHFCTTVTQKNARKEIHQHFDGGWQDHGWVSTLNIFAFVNKIIIKNIKSEWLKIKNSSAVWYPRKGLRWPALGFKAKTWVYWNDNLTQVTSPFCVKYYSPELRRLE